MPTKLTPEEVAAFEAEGGFPHGGRKGLEFDFAAVCDGDLWNITQSEWWNGEGKEITAETFLGSLSRYANANGLRVNKNPAADGKSVLVRARPKKVGEATESEAVATEAAASAPTRSSKTPPKVKA
jgi:hypothetical protein